MKKNVILLTILSVILLQIGLVLALEKELKEIDNEKFLELATKQSGKKRSCAL